MKSVEVFSHMKANSISNKNRPHSAVQSNRDLVKPNCQCIECGGDGVKSKKEKSNQDHEHTNDQISNDVIINDAI